MAKTAAELQAEANAAAQAAASAKAREEEERRRAEEQRSATLWEWFKGFIPDFSFFNILLFVGLAVGAYMLGKTESGVKLLEQGIALLPESWQPGASGLLNKIGIKTDIGAPLLKLADKDIVALRETLKSAGLAPQLIASIAKNKDTFTSFLKPIMDAHEGRATVEDLTPTAIVASPALATYLKPENRATTVALIRAALPADAGISEKTIHALIAHGVDAHGKPTAQFNKLITAATDGRLQKLQSDLNDAHGKLSLPKTIDVLLDAKSRALIRAIGTDTIAIVAHDKSPQLNQRTLDAALAFGDAIDKNPANNGANRARTVAVLHAVANLAANHSADDAFKEAFKGITADQLSGFIAVPGNQAAVYKLLLVVDPALAKHWGNADQGLAEVLASKPDADKILKLASGNLTWLESAASSVVGYLPTALTPSLETQLRYFGGGKISKNAPDIAAVIPAPTPARPPAQTTGRS